MKFEIMTYTEEQLLQIEQFASIHLKLSDVAVIIAIPSSPLLFEIVLEDSLSFPLIRRKPKVAHK